MYCARLAPGDREFCVLPSRVEGRACFACRLSKTNRNASSSRCIGRVKSTNIGPSLCTLWRSNRSRMGILERFEETRLIESITGRENVRNQHGWEYAWCLEPVTSAFPSTQRGSSRRWEDTLRVARFCSSGNRGDGFLNRGHLDSLTLEEILSERCVRLAEQSERNRSPALYYW